MTEPVAISLFAGAGGLDYDVTAAGFRVAAANECVDDAADTLEKNFGGYLTAPVDRRPIEEVPTGDLLRALALVVGGPPCTPFSKSGFHLAHKRAGLDPDASLLSEYARVLREARPRAFILENVYALVFNNKASRPRFKRLLSEIDEAGYHCRWDVLNAADYGVAQSRPRLFVVGVGEEEAASRSPRTIAHRIVGRDSHRSCRRWLPAHDSGRRARRSPLRPRTGRGRWRSMGQPARRYRSRR